MNDIIGSIFKVSNNGKQYQSHTLELIFEQIGQDLHFIVYMPKNKGLGYAFLDMDTYFNNPHINVELYSDIFMEIP